MPIRVAVPLPGPFVWTPRGQGRRRRGGGDSGEELIVGFFLVLIFAGWAAMGWAFQESVTLGLLSIVGYLAWLALWGRAWMWVLRNDDIDEDSATGMTACVASLAVGVPVLFGNAMAWWVPPVGVAVNLATVVAVAYGVQVSRRWRAARGLALEAAADAAEVAAIQAEIDAVEAEQARINTSVTPRGLRWSPPGYERRDEVLVRHSQGSRLPPSTQATSTR